MYARLADFPVLDRYRFRIPAAAWNVWYRQQHRHPPVAQRRMDLPGLEPLQLILEERLWVCVDPTLADAPVIAWQRFESAGRRDLSAAVPCTVLQYHFGASRYRDRIISVMAEQLELLSKG